MDEPGLNKVDIPLAGGVDEYSPVTGIAQEDYLELTNFRLTKDGKRIKKRYGLSDLGLTESDDIYGYATYYNSDYVFCQLLATESKLRRKITGGSWADIHSWAAPLVHPVRPLEIQGKQFIIAETDSRMVHTDGNDYQIGITAPATLPTLSAGSGGAMTAGIYRYAITYERGGNYSCESNPIKSLVGAVAFTGSGLNDCTSGGTYTGDANKTVRVRIDGTGTPDTIEVSYDGGSTWSVTDLPVTSTVYLHYGLTLTFAATTGHTATDYWQFTASACAVTVTANQQVTLTNIPVSSDPQVTRRNIYRTVIGGARFYWLVTIDNNTGTTFVDNLPDSYLGDEMEEDHDVMPNGKFSCFWDNRLWVTSGNTVYYSEIDVPEEFDLIYRFINIRQSRQGDEITQMIPYQDSIYVFTRFNIHIIMKKSGGAYGRYLVKADMGCTAPWSMIEANGLLMFFSYRGLEKFDGTDVLPIEFSVPVSRTWAAQNRSKFDYICSVHNRKDNEAWFTLPDTAASTTKKTVVYNYVRNKFAVFEWHKIPSFIGEARDSSKEVQVYMGTRDGYVFTAESGYQDGSTNISATLRKGWYDIVVYGSLRKFHVEYELPDNKTLNLKAYSNFSIDDAVDHGFPGHSPGTTDAELTRPIKDYTSIDVRGKYFAFSLSNNENLGGDLKINKVMLFLKGGAIKERIHAD